jgi:protein-disulfide isomerase
MASNAEGGRRPAGQLFRGRNALLIGVAVASIAIAAGLIIASQVGSGGSSTSSVTTPATMDVAGAAETAALLKGIPQSGTTLGRPNAPVTMREYADLQCPYCAVYAVDVLPTIVKEYVRTGKVKLVFSGMDFVGPDSEKALRAIEAAGLQNRSWNVLDLIYRNQGAENTGWVSDALLASIGGAVTGLDAQKMLADANSQKVTDRLAADQSQAQASGIDGTPSFEVGKTGGTLQRLQITALDPAAFRPALDALLKQ